MRPATERMIDDVTKASPVHATGRLEGEWRWTAKEVDELTEFATDRGCAAYSDALLVLGHAADQGEQEAREASAVLGQLVRRDPQVGAALALIARQAGLVAWLDGFQAGMEQARQLQQGAAQPGRQRAAGRPSGQRGRRGRRHG